MGQLWGVKGLVSVEHQGSGGLLAVSAAGPAMSQRQGGAPPPSYCARRGAQRLGRSRCSVNP